MLSSRLYHHRIRKQKQRINAGIDSTALAGTLAVRSRKLRNKKHPNPQFWSDHHHDNYELHYQTKLEWRNEDTVRSQRDSQYLVAINKTSSNITTNHKFCQRTHHHERTHQHELTRRIKLQGWYLLPRELNHKYNRWFEFKPVESQPSKCC